MADADGRWPGWRRHACLLVALALATGGAWAAVIPPFEGPDELFFYSEARQFAAHPERRENLLYRLAAPVIGRVPAPVEPADPPLNAAFQYVGNRHGEVNRWIRDRSTVGRGHARVLAALRLLVVVLAAVAALLFAAASWLCLPDRRFQWPVVGLCLWIPQASFMNAVVQREAATDCLGAAVALVVVARATGRLRRTSAWAMLLALIALVPLADRQAYFLVPFAAVSLVVSERTWRQRGLAALAIAAPAIGTAWLVTHWVETGTDLSPWLRILRDPLGPFTGQTGSGGPSAAYYAFEFLPKLFMGFWGWLGQPSILLPAWIYGGLFALSGASAVGLLIRLFHARTPAPTDDERGRLHARRLLAVGVVLMCGPIVYGPTIAGRNLWYGHWLFPMLGPIAMGFVLGLAETVRLARQFPHRIAVLLVLVAGVGGASWLSAPGDAMRAAIVVNHYGDAARVISTLGDAMLALAVAAVAVELWAYLPRWKPRVPIGPAVAGTMAALNAILLFGVVRPLYAEVTPAGYVRLITRYVAARELDRAANIFASATKAYPADSMLNELGNASPRLLLDGGRPDEMFLLLERYLARGGALRDRDALLAVAARLRGSPWRGSDALTAALADAARDTGLAEPVRLVERELRHEGDAADSVAPIEAGQGRRLMLPIRNEALLEGYTTHDLAEGTQIIVYMRPRTNADNRRLWMHAYPAGDDDYLTIEPTIAPGGWQPGELVWEVFELPKGRFKVFVGMWVGTDIGPGAPLGEVP